MILPGERSPKFIRMITDTRSSILLESMESICMNMCGMKTELSKKER